jgi:CubicO group peptidase (beta-lactamase class C family)
LQRRTKFSGSAWLHIRGSLIRGLVAALVGLCLGAPGMAEMAAAPDPIAVAVQREMAAGHIPGAVVVIGDRGRVIYRRAFGERTAEPRQEPMAIATIFDLASLTKVVGTTIAAMQLVEAGKLDLDKPVAAYWPEFAASGKGAITVRHLMTHVSGLPAGLDRSMPWRGEGEGLARAAAVTPLNAPGTVFLYSDVDYVVLGNLVQRISGQPLDRYLQAHVFGPLRMRDTMFRPGAERLSKIAPTQRIDGHLFWGEVEDPTTSRMGGVAGQAGLFSTADDLTRFTKMLLNGGVLGGRRVLKPRTVKLMETPAALPGGAQRSLGWDVSSGYSVGMDKAFGPGSFGHTGYTGTLLWIDPPSGRFLILLSSRLYPDGHGDVTPLRREIASILRSDRPGICLNTGASKAPPGAVRRNRAWLRQGKPAPGGSSAPGPR